jgi:hypothetical protein
MSSIPEAENIAAVTGAPAAPRVERALDSWKQFLRDEDTRLGALKVPAALATIGLARAGDLDRALAALGAVARPTDRIGLLCDDEISMLFAPVVDIHEAQRLVQAASHALHMVAVDAHVGWAMRLPGHGLFHALARADAAMLTAKGHGHLALDLGAREQRVDEA